MKRFYSLPIALLAVLALAGCEQLAQRKQALAAEAAASSAPAASAQQNTAGQAAQQQVSVDFRLAQTQQDKGLSQLKFKDGTSVWYLPQPVLSRADLANAEPRRTKQGQAFVRFTFTQPGAKKLASLTQRYPGKFLILTLGNSLQAVYQIRQPSTNGILDIGVDTDQHAVDMVNTIAGRRSTK